MGNVAGIGAFRVPSPLPALYVEFVGERHEVPAGPAYSLGRAADLDIDDNPYLHRRFLEIRREGGMWWIENVGSHLTARIVDAADTVHVSLGPGGRLPIVVPRLHVLFTAGPTSYDLTLVTERPVSPAGRTSDIDARVEDTLGRVALNDAQRLLLLVLAEERLRLAGGRNTAVPASASAAARLGWTLPAFTRRLDHLCAKLERAGARGLRAGEGRLATLRRVRLVEHALATGLIGRADLPLLDAAVAEAAGRSPSRPEAD